MQYQLSLIVIIFHAPELGCENLPVMLVFNDTIQVIAQGVMAARRNKDDMVK